MNQALQNTARSKIKEGLKKLPESNQLLFKRMYSHDNLDLPIDQVVDNMPAEKLDWALTQVQNTLEDMED